MKKMLYWTGVLTLTILFASCSSSRKASKSTPVTPGEIEVTIPLGGPEYQSDAEYWRAVQTGTSKDMSMAKKVAMQNARQDLAATVQAPVEKGQLLGRVYFKLNGETLYTYDLLSDREIPALTFFESFKRILLSLCT